MPDIIQVSPTEKVRYIRYVCTKCKAEDTLKLFQGESVPACVNCAQCKAGYGHDIQTMMQQRLGMFVRAELTLADIEAEEAAKKAAQTPLVN